MTGNMIACIIFLSVGIIGLAISVYCFVRMIVKNEEYQFIPGMLFCVLGGVLVIASLAHWNDDEIYKKIECQEYRVEKHVTYSHYNSADTTYTIFYKIKK